MRKLIKYFMTIILVCLNHQINGHAQNMIIRSIFSNGASIGQNDNHQLITTLGQTAIGISRDSSLIISSGFWYFDDNFTTDVKKAESKLPREFCLEQNYPNPFNPSTTISFNLPKQSFVKLKVYNILGEEVATLINEIKQAGNYREVFNASELPSGVYIYKITADEFSSTKKMILIK